MWCRVIAHISKSRYGAPDLGARQSLLRFERTKSSRRLFSGLEMTEDLMPGGGSPVLRIGFDVAEESGERVRV